MDYRTITACTLSPEAFCPFGKVISFPKTGPNKWGNGWKSWTPIELLETRMTVGIGVVITEPRELILVEMERHVSREELILPVTGSLVQPVALPKYLKDADAVPDEKDVQAFIIEPGQAIVMNKGVWHSAAFPADNQEVLYYFAIENSHDEIGDMLNPWVRLSQNEILKIVV